MSSPRPGTAAAQWRSAAAHTAQVAGPACLPRSTPNEMRTRQQAWRGHLIQASLLRSAEALQDAEHAAAGLAVGHQVLAGHQHQVRADLPRLVHLCASPRLKALLDPDFFEASAGKPAAPPSAWSRLHGAPHNCSSRTGTCPGASAPQQAAQARACWEQRAPPNAQGSHFDTLCTGARRFHRLQATHCTKQCYQCHLERTSASPQVACRAAWVACFPRPMRARAVSLPTQKVGCIQTLHGAVQT